MKLIIAEKPSVAQDIGKALGVFKKGNGYLYNDEYYISWAIGHLVTLYNPEDYDESLKKWVKNTLPILPGELKIKPTESTKKQLKIIKDLVNKSEVNSLICATDSGREGELIFRHIYNYTKCKKPFERLWISSMTREAILNGFNNLKPSSDYDNLYYSAKCRQEADWIVGINSTRAYTIAYNAMLSIGRVQTPTLNIIVERQKEIDDFKSKTYFELFANFDGYVGKWIDDENNSKIESLEDVQELKNKVSNYQGKVVDIQTEEKKVKAPLLFDLTELQRVCNTKFGLSAQDTLNTVQALYEKHKLVTYPRTDSRYISSDMQNQAKETLNNLCIEPYSEYVNKVIAKGITFTKRIVDDSKITDHHAIIPTGKVGNIGNLNETESKVFDAIVKQFIAVFYDDYVYSITKIITGVDSEKFITKGTTIVQLGFKEVLIDDTKNKEEILPNVNIDDVVNVASVEHKEKQTKPPKAYNEASLLSAMENAGRFIDEDTEHLNDGGIGTPATRASIIERLIQVGYLERKGKILMATEKGLKLAQICHEELKSPLTTEKWEKALYKIAKGEMSHENFMNSIRKFANFVVESANNKVGNIEFAESKKSKYEVLNAKCPTCGKDIISYPKSYSCSSGKDGDNFVVWKEIAGKQISVEQAEKLIKTGKSDLIKGFKSKAGKKFNAYLVLDNGKVEFKFK